MGIQQICKVKSEVSAVKPDGTQEQSQVVPFYFRGSGVYKHSASIVTATQVEHIPRQFWDGDIPLTPVADLIRAGIVARITVVVKLEGTEKRRKYELVVDAERRAAIFDGTGTGNLINKDFKLMNRDGTARQIGKIVKLIESTDAYHP